MPVAQAVKRARSRPVTVEDYFIFENVTWEYYLETLEQLERAGQHAHVTFDDGRMEIMTTSGWHELIKTHVARLLEHYSFVKDIPIIGMGNPTFLRPKRKGIEPDECYFIKNNYLLDSTLHLDLKKGPPPDLVIEVVVTRSDFPKRPIFAHFGVPELWSIDSKRIQILSLNKGEYVPVKKSQFLPDLNMVEFDRFVRMANENQFKAVKAFDAWLRQTGEKK